MLRLRSELFLKTDGCEAAVYADARGDRIVYFNAYCEKFFVLCTDSGRRLAEIDATDAHGNVRRRARLSGDGARVFLVATGGGTSASSGAGELSVCVHHVESGEEEAAAAAPVTLPPGVLQLPRQALELAVSPDGSKVLLKYAYVAYVAGGTTASSGAGGRLRRLCMLRHTVACCIDDAGCVYLAYRTRGGARMTASSGDDERLLTVVAVDSGDDGDDDQAEDPLAMHARVLRMQTIRRYFDDVEQSIRLFALGGRRVAVCGTDGEIAHVDLSEEEAVAASGARVRLVHARIEPYNLPKLERDGSVRVAAAPAPTAKRARASRDYNKPALGLSCVNERLWCSHFQDVHYFFTIE